MQRVRKLSLVMGPDTDGARSAGRGFVVGVRVRLEEKRERVLKVFDRGRGSPIRARARRRRR
jgi:hypothetical protein